LELSGQKARIGSALINGTLTGDRGRVISTDPVVIGNTGTIAGGWIGSEGLLTIEGDLELSDDAVTYSYLKGGSGPASDGSGTDYGTILVTGSATIDGTLKLVRAPGYTPAAGDALYVMLRDGGSGTFDEIIVVDGTTSVTYPAAEGTQITIGGKVGVISYKQHYSVNLSSPDTAADIRIRF